MSDDAQPVEPPLHWPTLVFEDGDGDLCRCDCGEQGYDFKQGREWFAAHLSHLRDADDDAVLAAVVEAHADAALDAARAAPEMTAADGRHPDHACGQVPCPHLALTESSAPEPSSIDVETLARALHSGSHHYRGGADDSLAKTACIQFGWEDSKCMRQAKGLAERYRRLSNLPDRASPNDAARAGTDPREPHGVSGLFHHEPGAPCIVCDRHAALPPAAPEIDVETLARAAYEDRPPIGSRPVPWTPEKRRAWRAWAQRVARRLRYDLPDHAIEEQVDKPE